MFNPSESLDLEGERFIDCDNANGLRIIVAMSGKNNQYDPDEGEFPVPE